MIKEEWKNEADLCFWVDRATGYVCCVCRNKLTESLCGYVRVPTDHKLWGKSYMDDDMPDIKVHGGVTYSRYRALDDSWIFGFDCSHDNDLCPKYYNKFSVIEGQTYKNMDYVVQQCKNLARQLKKLEV